MSSQSGDIRLYRQMYLSFGGVAMVCAVIIVTTFEYTIPFIEINKNQALERAIFAVQPLAQSKKPFIPRVDGSFTAAENTTDSVIYATYDKQHNLIGFAIPASGMGYQDTIHLLYGYDPNSQTIVGLKVLQSRETPGLGSRIETDKEFLDNFRELDVALNNDKSTLANAIRVVKPGQKMHSWQIDSISGATVSSQAIGDTLQRSTTRWLPQIQQHIEDFR